MIKFLLIFLVFIAYSCSIFGFDSSHHLSANVELVVMTYTHDKERIQTMLIPSLQRFVNRVEFSFTAILDEERPSDHEMGNELSSKFGFKTKYNVLEPWSPILSVTPFRKSGGKYMQDGYTRQLYVTFFFDQYSDADIIGIVDSDVQLTSYLSKSSIFTPDGKIIVQGIAEDELQQPYMYGNDRLALKTDRPLLDVMGCGSMPQFIHRSTFKNCRDYMMAVHNVTTFEALWQIIAANPMSPVNVILNYALIREPHRYRAVSGKERAAFPIVGELRAIEWSMLSLCSHYAGWNLPYSSELHKVGCCRAYNVSCTSAMSNDVNHVIAPVGGTYPPAVLNLLSTEHIENTTKAVAAYYVHLRHQVHHLHQNNATVLERMISACIHE